MLFGGSGNDMLRGGSGNDMLKGRQRLTPAARHTKTARGAGEQPAPRLVLRVSLRGSGRKTVERPLGAALLPVPGQFLREGKVA